MPLVGLRKEVKNNYQFIPFAIMKTFSEENTILILVENGNPDRDFLEG
ncbi:hypothetical protein [Frigoriflavimonas asaccharolytica]|uniref:Uncharacterized protein n=1 Tax=Frigoriflavimonas asaccharolytica TaxID=2735899 RepID=A0A8J8G978_9FLAO|nr:hypothetical protein [Frigoriflavimonas asaccharolytica]NRS93216.1 hypothetical protein [Frigoriflavimonas asaccharolytica]